MSKKKRPGQMRRPMRPGHNPQVVPSHLVGPQARPVASIAASRLVARPPLTTEGYPTPGHRAGGSMLNDWRSMPWIDLCQVLRSI